MEWSWYGLSLDSSFASTDTSMERIAVSADQLELGVFSYHSNSRKIKIDVDEETGNPPQIRFPFPYTISTHATDVEAMDPVSDLISSRAAELPPAPPPPPPVGPALSGPSPSYAVHLMSSSPPSKNHAFSYFASGNLTGTDTMEDPGTSILSAETDATWNWYAFPGLRPTITASFLWDGAAP